MHSSDFSPLTQSATQRYIFFILYMWVVGLWLSFFSFLSLSWRVGCFLLTPNQFQAHKKPHPIFLRLSKSRTALDRWQQTVARNFSSDDETSPILHHVIFSASPARRHHPSTLDSIHTLSFFSRGTHFVSHRKHNPSQKFPSIDNMCSHCIYLPSNFFPFVAF